ncbi:MAG: hypothetical protein M3P08_01420 [Thermoproteota archaeon]|nr:hypothetical protein [Thermoproteota archaeon]
MNEERLEQYVQQPQLQPQLAYNQPPQQPAQQRLLEQGQQILAIPAICNNWERKWEELMHLGPWLCH